MDSNPQPHKRFICSWAGCRAAYNKQWKLDAHTCTHTGVRPYACPRAGCGKAFCTQHHLARHQLTHSGARPFPCPLPGCPQAFTTNCNLSRHVGRVHSQEEHRTYACTSPGCGLEFRKNKQLKAHVGEQHTQLPPYQCTHEGCTMRFSFPSKLKRHQKVHRGYPCQEEEQEEEGGCSFRAKTWTELLQHRKEQHRPILRCEQCSKVFRDSWFLQQHQRVHSDVRLVFKCPRDGCDRSFTKIFNLQSHINSFHEELQPFACTHPGCGKSFVMKQSLQRHSVAHDPERRKLKKPRKSKPRRSLASRLSGHAEAKTLQEPESGSRGSAERSCDPPGPVELVSLLQDASLLYSPAGVDTHGLTRALTSPLSV